MERKKRLLQRTSWGCLKKIWPPGRAPRRTKQTRVLEAGTSRQKQTDAIETWQEQLALNTAVVYLRQRRLLRYKNPVRPAGPPDRNKELNDPSSTWPPCAETVQSSCSGYDGSHCNVLGNETADSLAKEGATKEQENRVAIFREAKTVVAKARQRGTEWLQQDPRYNRLIRRLSPAVNIRAGDHLQATTVWTTTSLPRSELVSQNSAPLSYRQHDRKISSAGTTTSRQPRTSALANGLSGGEEVFRRFGLWTYVNTSPWSGRPAVPELRSCEKVEEHVLGARPW